MPQTLPKISEIVAVVVIGRNEGQRLRNCFESLLIQTKNIIYVDSGSTDNSLEMAKSLGVEVFNLDTAIGFTAARARNAGFFRLLESYPKLRYVLFVDGDCQVNPNWIATALNYLEKNSDIAVVCGRRKEIHPESSIYNQLCDFEWDTPIGEAKSCGGDALMRVEAISAINGYRENLIAGEEPELCVRLRQNGWRVWRLDAPMTLHDAGMLHFRQWWKRATRGGYAFAEGAHLHGSAPEYHWVAESNRAWRWGLFLPLAALICFIFKPWLGFLVLLAYPLQIIRLTFKSKLPPKTAFIKAFFLTLGKFAEVLGQLKFLWHHYTNKQSRLIEYK
jgi:GT2 family glycosyltransferase